MNRFSLLDSTLVRHAPIAATFAFAAVFVFAVPEIGVTDLPDFDIGLMLAAAATVLSVVPVTTLLGTVLFSVVPGVDLAAIALLGSGTGGTSSVFIALVVLPVLWLASSAGQRQVIYALVGSMVVLLAPFALDPGTHLTALGIVRLVVSLIVLTTITMVTHLLAGATRGEVRAAQSKEVRGIEEIDRAAAVQRSLLPDGSAATPRNITVAGRCLPAKSVGGDFFDWYDIGDGMAFTVGDVMGKGVGAGLIAAAVRAAVRSAHSVDDPVEALRRASDGLDVAASAANVTFTTLFHARLSNDGVLRWADAGHGLSSIIRVDGTVERLESTNLPLGLDTGEEWQSHTTHLEPGDVLVSVSDGVLDLFDSMEAAAADRNATARRNSDPEAIVTALVARADEVPHDDDVTVVAMRREPQPQPESRARAVHA